MHRAADYWEGLAHKLWHKKFPRPWYKLTYGVAIEYEEIERKIIGGKKHKDIGYRLHD